MADSVSTADYKQSVNDGIADHERVHVETTAAINITSQSLLSSSSSSWLSWKRIIEAVIMSCVIITVWGLFSVPTILYGLQVKLITIVVYLRPC